MQNQPASAPARNRTEQVLAAFSHRLPAAALYRQKLSPNKRGQCLHFHASFHFNLGSSFNQKKSAPGQLHQSTRSQYPPMFKQEKKKKVASDMGSRCPSISSLCQCPLKPRSPQYWNSLVLQLLKENRKQQKQQGQEHLYLKEKPQPGTTSADQSNNNNNNKPRSPSQPLPPQQKCLKRTSEPEKKFSSTFRNNCYFDANFSGDPYEVYDPLPNSPLYDCRNRSSLYGQNTKSAFNGDNSSSSSSSSDKAEGVVVYSTPKRPRLEIKKVLPVTKVIIIKSSSSASMKTEKLVKEEETADSSNEGKLVIDEEA